MMMMVSLGGCAGSEVASEQPAESYTEPEYVEPEPVETTQPDLTSDSASWDYKNGAGYTCSVTLTVWEPIPADAVGIVAHPADKPAPSTQADQSEPTVILDSASDYDPKTDMVIPLSVGTQNTTDGFDLEGLQVNSQCAGLPCTDPEYTISPARALDFTFFYSDGNQTKSMAFATSPADSWGGNRMQIQTGTDSFASTTTWTDPLAPDERGGALGFAILHDYYSPAAPQGDAAMLELLMLTPNMGFADWTPVTKTGPQGITLGGQLVPAAQ